MMILVERIKSLVESAESLGFSKMISNQVDDLIDSGRKNKHYLAKLFKESDLITDAPRKNILSTIKHNHDDLIGLYETLSKKLGVKPNSNVDEDNVDKYIYELITPENIEELLHYKKKIIKASPNDIEDELNDMVVLAFGEYVRENEELIWFLNEDPNNYRELKGLSSKEAINLAKDKLEGYHRDKDSVLYEFSDGWYWYEVPPEECEKEGNNMNVCDISWVRGRSILSLRDRDNNPHVTVDYNHDREAISQLRGKGNSLPKKKYWKYIEVLFKDILPKGTLLGDIQFKSREELMPEFYQFISDIGNDNVDDSLLKYTKNRDSMSSMSV